MAEAYGFDADGARRIGETVRRVERSSLGGDPGRARWPVGAGGSGVERLGKSPASAIAGGATGTVTFYTWGSTTSLGSETITATNPWPDSCPANRKVLIGTVNGVANCIKSWSCVGV
jgi:hypothetical protein